MFLSEQEYDRLMRQGQDMNACQERLIVMQGDFNSRMAELETENRRLREALESIRDRWAYPKLVQVVDETLEAGDE